MSSANWWSAWSSWLIWSLISIAKGVITTMITVMEKQYLLSPDVISVGWLLDILLLYDIVLDTDTKENSIVCVSCCLYMRSFKWKRQVIKRCFSSKPYLNMQSATCMQKRHCPHWHASWSLIAMDVSLGGYIFYACSLHCYDLKKLIYSVIAPIASQGKWLIFYFC